MSLQTICMALPVRFISSPTDENPAPTRVGTKSLCSTLADVSGSQEHHLASCRIVAPLSLYPMIPPQRRLGQSPVPRLQAPRLLVGICCDGNLHIRQVHVTQGKLSSVPSLKDVGPCFLCTSSHILRGIRPSRLNCFCNSIRLLTNPLQRHVARSDRSARRQNCLCSQPRALWILLAVAINGGSDVVAMAALGLHIATDDASR